MIYNIGSGMKVNTVSSLYDWEKSSFYLFLYCLVPLLISPLGSFLKTTFSSKLSKSEHERNQRESEERTHTGQAAGRKLSDFDLLSAETHRSSPLSGKHHVTVLYSNLSTVFPSLAWFLPVPNQVMFLTDLKTFSFLILPDFA